MRVQDQKSDKLRLKNLHSTCFGGKINWFEPKNSAKRRELLIWRTKKSGQASRYTPTQGFNFASHESKLVPRKLDPGPLDWTPKVGLRFNPICHKGHLTNGFKLEPPNRQILSLEGPRFRVQGLGLNSCQIPYTYHLHEIDCSICSVLQMYHTMFLCA